MLRIDWGVTGGGGGRCRNRETVRRLCGISIYCLGIGRGDLEIGFRHVQFEIISYPSKDTKAVGIYML